MTKYQKIVAAALKEEKSGFEMAEALATEIPRIGSGNRQENGTLTRSLEEAAREIEDAGGRAYAVNTLRQRRQAALWVQRNANDTRVSFGWREGSSLSAHQIAAASGLDWAEWSKLPRTKAETQRMAGNKVQGDSEIAKLDPMEQADALTTLVDMNPDLVIAAAEKAHAKRIVKEAERITRTATTKTPADVEPKRVQIETLLGEMDREVRLQRKFIPRMIRTRIELGGSMSAAQMTHFDEALDQIASIIDDARKAVS